MSHSHSGSISWHPYVHKYRCTQHTYKVINKAARPCWPGVAAAQTQASDWPTSSQAQCRSSVCVPLSSLRLICILKKGLREEKLKVYKFYSTVTYDLPRKSGTKMYFQTLVRVWRVKHSLLFLKTHSVPSTHMSANVCPLLLQLCRTHRLLLTSLGPVIPSYRQNPHTPNI